MHNPAISGYSLNLLNTAENNGAVGATKAKVVFNGHIDLHISSSIRTVVQIALWILIEDVDGWRRFLMMQSQHGEY